MIHRDLLLIGLEELALLHCSSGQGTPESVIAQIDGVILTFVLTSHLTLLERLGHDWKLTCSAYIEVIKTLEILDVSYTALRIDLERKLDNESL